MTGSRSETKALQSCSKGLQQSIFRLLAHPVAPNCFRRQTFHVLNSEFVSARLWSAFMKLVYINQSINQFIHQSFNHQNFQLTNDDPKLCTELRSSSLEDGPAPGVGVLVPFLDPPSLPSPPLLVLPPSPISIFCSSFLSASSRSWVNWGWG